MRMNDKGQVGIVLGKYSRTTSDSKTFTDVDEIELGGPDSAMYKDAIDLARRSGQGYSSLSDHPGYSDF